MTQHLVDLMQIGVDLENRVTAFFFSGEPAYGEILLAMGL